LFARYGGEEFCLCVFDADTEEVVDITTRCLESINQKHFETSAGHLPITASFGVAFLSEHGTVDSTGLIGRADKMLYDAKHGGRNRVCR
jgi:diguanylate cyclase (GGDEF)-like protein